MTENQVRIIGRKNLWCNRDSCLIYHYVEAEFVTVEWKLLRKLLENHRVGVSVTGKEENGSGIFSRPHETELCVTICSEYLCGFIHF